MITEPKIIDRSEQPSVGIRVRVPMSELPVVIPQLFDEVYNWLEAKSIPSSGAPFVRYHVINMEDKLDIEMAWPVAKAVAGDERVRADVLPAGKYGIVTYTGDYSGLMEANRVLVDWAKETGVQWDRWDDVHGDAFRSRIEIYENGPGDTPDPAQWVTDVLIKLADK